MLTLWNLELRTTRSAADFARGELKCSTPRFRQIQQVFHDGVRRLVGFSQEVSGWGSNRNYISTHNKPERTHSLFVEIASKKPDWNRSEGFPNVSVVIEFSL